MVGSTSGIVTYPLQPRQHAPSTQAPTTKAPSNQAPTTRTAHAVGQLLFRNHKRPEQRLRIAGEPLRPPDHHPLPKPRQLRRMRCLHVRLTLLQRPHRRLRVQQHPVRPGCHVSRPPTRVPPPRPLDHRRRPPPPVVLLPVRGQRPPRRVLRVQLRLGCLQRRLQLPFDPPQLLQPRLRPPQLRLELRGPLLGHHEAPGQVLGVQLRLGEGALEAGHGVGAGGNVLLQRGVAAAGGCL